MKESSEIKNCFEFICPLKWKNLETTGNNDIKFCGSCKKQVFKANDFETTLNAFCRYRLTFCSLKNL